MMRRRGYGDELGREEKRRGYGYEEGDEEGIWR